MTKGKTVDQVASEISAFGGYTSWLKGKQPPTSDWDMLAEALTLKLTGNMSTPRKLPDVIDVLKKSGSDGEWVANKIRSGVFDEVPGYYKLVEQASSEVGMVKAVKQALQRADEVVQRGTSINLLQFEHKLTVNYKDGGFDVDLGILTAPGSTDFRTVYQFKTMQGSLKGSVINKAGEQLINVKAENKIIDIVCAPATSRDEIFSQSVVAGLKKQIESASVENGSAGITHFHFYIANGDIVELTAAQVRALNQ
jgi:hypothetical protein